MLLSVPMVAEQLRRRGAEVDSLKCLKLHPLVVIRRLQGGDGGCCGHT